MTPDKNVKPFEKGEKLTADRLDQTRSPVASLLRILESQFGQPADGQTPATTVPVEISSTSDTGRVGVLNGKIRYPPVKPLSTATSDDLAIGNLGDTSTRTDSAEVVDAEVWDLSQLENMRLGHYAGRNSDGVPILIVDSSGLTAPQYQGMAFVGVTANTAGWEFIPAVNSIPST